MARGLGGSSDTPVLVWEVERLYERTSLRRATPAARAVLHLRPDF
jgi:hypothetical protein